MSEQSNWIKQQKIIESKYDLKFESKTQERLFYEMFYALLFSRRHVGRRYYSDFDIYITFSALCMLPYPGKTRAYQNDIEQIKFLYYNVPVIRKIILNSLRKPNLSFRKIQSSETEYFRDVEDLFPRF